MHDDDRMIGQVLSRREVVAIAGAAGLTLLTGRSLLSQEPARTCVVRPRQTEGPFFVDEMLHRADIRSDPSNGEISHGLPLDLTINVSRMGGAACAPLAGAMVDVWQCDKDGVYSDARDPQFNTIGRKFLRGYQLTDTAGNARFATIYPGWYRGRAVHIHFKIRSPRSATPGYEFTSQLYFDDAFTDQVHAREPYAAKGQRNMRNQNDGIFRRERGAELIMDVQARGEGYAGTFNVALQIA